MTNCAITFVYKPPHIETTANSFCSLNTDSHFVVEYFNSHSSLWGYSDHDGNGEAMIQWAETNSLTLLHDSKFRLPSIVQGGAGHITRT